MVACRYRPGGDRFARRREALSFAPSPTPTTATARLRRVSGRLVLPTNAVEVSTRRCTGAVTRLLRERVPARWLPPSPMPDARGPRPTRPDVLTVGPVPKRFRSPMTPSTRSLSRRHGTGWIAPDCARGCPRPTTRRSPGVLWNGPARDVEWVAELLGPAARGWTRQRPRQASLIRATIRRPVHDARDDRDHLVHAGDPRRAGRSRQHLQRGDHASARSGWRSSAGGATGYRPRGFESGRQSSCHEMQVLRATRS